MVHADETRQSFAKRLRQAALKAGMPDRGMGVQLASVAGTTPKAAGKWLNGESIPRQEKLALIAEHCGVREEWLRFGKGQMTEDASHSPSNAEWSGEMAPWDDSTPVGPDEVEVRMFSEVEIQGGNGSAHAVEWTGQKVRFSKRTLSKAGVAPEAAGCAKVTGNSMDPVMPEGTTVGINTADRQVRDGKTYALDHLGLLRVKLLYRQPGGGLRIASYNKEEFPDEILTPEQAASDIRIIGHVFWWSVLEL